MFQRSLLLAVLMILTGWLPAATRSRWIFGATFVVWALFWGLAVSIATNMSHPPAVGWFYLLLMLAIPVAWGTNLKWHWRTAISLGCVMVGYGIALVEFQPAYRDHQELLAKYPAVDLQPRLNTEQYFGTLTGTEYGPPAVPGLDRESLQEFESETRSYLDLNTFRLELRQNDRRLAFKGLMQVHTDYVTDFINQPGVGRSRLPQLHLLRKGDLAESWEGIPFDLPPGLIAQPQPQARDKTLAATSKYSTMLLSQIPSQKTVQDYHHRNIKNFAPLFSLGAVNDKLEARGFQAHAFHVSPENPEFSLHSIGWNLTRLELVSLLKHQPPAVYVSQHLPAMDELRAAPTRSVTPFELTAINELLKGEDLLLKKSSDHEFLMLGSIRAINQCRECHQVPYGALLGAFTYSFDRLNTRDVVR
jgi:hypothetical protein